MKTVSFAVAKWLLFAIAATLLVVPQVYAERPRPLSSMAPLVTKTPKLPQGQAGYYYSASAEPVAYVSDAVTMIRFGAINFDLLPTLVLELPSGIDLLAGVRGFDIEPPTDIVRNGEAYRRYRIVPKSANSSKFTYFWKSSLPSGGSHTGYFCAEWAGGRQPEQKLAINVIALPQRRRFQNVPVWYTIPSDMADTWNSAESYCRGGFNTLDVWCYLSPEEKQWGDRLVGSVAKKYESVDLWGWPQDWWWRRGRSTPEGQSVSVDGKRTEELNLLYRGKHFHDWIEAGKSLIEHGIYTHTSDPEIYRQVDQTVGYSDACRANFQAYATKCGLALSENDPRVFMNAQDEHPQAVRVWRRWRATKYTDFFVEYRKAMEAHMKSLGIDKPFRFVIYSTYHRHWESFHGYDDYESAPPYILTLEDPKDLTRRAFDVLSPMAYPDLYSTKGAFDELDMTLSWKDTYSLVKILENRAPVMPLLSTGYPYTYYERDLSPQMIKYSILEAIAGGARGFGFWGEGIHDAKDMAVTAKLVDQLVPAEDLIVNGTPFVAEPSRGTAFVKGIVAKQGALILVSEYSQMKRDVELTSPVAGTVIDIETGERIAVLSAAGQSFQISLDDQRARMFWVR